MRRLILGLLISAAVVAGAYTAWRYWLAEIYFLETQRPNDLVSVYKLTSHPSRYLNRPVVLKGYLHRIRTINSGDVLLYPNKTEAEMRNVVVAVPIAYPFDGKMACSDQYVEVSGVFEKLEENSALGITFPIHGVGQVDYLGKLEDTAYYHGIGLRRPSCPSRQLPDDHGVGTFRNAHGERVDDPYKWTREPGVDEADQKSGSQ